MASPLKIKVVGTGGIGLCLLPTLCRWLAHSRVKFPDIQISLIDGDQFEEKNRERQSFNELGPKATTTANAYRTEFPGLLFFDHPTYIDDNNIIQLIRENDIVMVCVDNHKTRKLISDRAEELKNVTIINGGNDYTDGNVLMHIRRDNKNITPPLASSYHPEIAFPTDKHPGEVAESQGCQVVAVSAPQLLIMNNMIAANMLAFLYNLLEDKQFAKIVKDPKNWHELLADLKSNKGPKAATRERILKEE